MANLANFKLKTSLIIIDAGNGWVKAFDSAGLD